MNAFVIKQWSASSVCANDGTYVHIYGRAGGLVSMVLNLLGISPTVRLLVRGDKIIFEKGSLEGTMHSLIPLQNTCSMFYAFKRPLKEALVLGFALGAATFFLFGIPGIAAAVVYYVLNKTLTIGFTDVGGRVHEVPFKRSILEGQVIDEKQAARVCEIIQALVDSRQEQALLATS